MIKYPDKVTLVEVGPRDGLQNEPTALSIETKVALIEQLAQAGIKRIEAGSFVSPKWVPQMANSEAVFQQLTRLPSVVYSALTPNLRGFDSALAVNVDEVAIFGAASESFSQKNINCSIAESLARFEAVIDAAKANNIPVRGYVSCVLGCPYEGDISPQSVLEVTQSLLDMGCYEVSLGDTIGTGTPVKTTNLLNVLLKDIDASKLAVHFHDTYGQALANILIALQHGIAVIDSAVAGLGGCPYAKGASGNVATEDVLFMLNGMNIETGIDLHKVVSAGQMITAELGRISQSKSALALAAH
ncbi:hydroxymethylglutaryl-CoA lyase [Alteromonas sediminis]|uniref:Hydroxymethylglutaryl-CoA lyase n=1 Tax=Alteromonas sediminis TaxID=2259342 RepID=A0A3N5Y8B5_9ALTE|nr:hydroxymethylglutaryl-CoA lyase [Alteromonas sediminis]RPJ67269.1 hydroxymethylglutaryl-CoA lyase [Alteromonas sediminis]